MMLAGIIIQARMGSSRAPGKIAHLFQGEAMLEYQIRRLQRWAVADVCIATTSNDEDSATADIATRMGVPCFRGSENDVMGRYLACAEYYGFDPIIRVGGDDPLIDPAGLKFLLDVQKEERADLLYASHPEGWIYGTAGELVTQQALKLAAEATTDPLDREHVISFLKRSDLFNGMPVSPPSRNQIRPDIFLSVDYKEDLALVDQILAYFTRIGRRYEFTQDELIALYDSGTLEIKNKHLHEGF